MLLMPSRLPEEELGIGTMWFQDQKQWWATAPAIAVASARAEQLDIRAREEMLSLLDNVPESEHELSFSDLVVVDDKDRASGDSSEAESGRWPTADQKVRQEGAASVKEGKDGDLGASKRRRSRTSAAAGSEQQVLQKPNKCNSCRAGSEGVLLNLYMPSSLTRSLTSGSASRSRRYSNARERPAPACTAPISEEVQKAKSCWWSSLWVTKEKQRNTRKSSSRNADEKGKNDMHKKKKKVQLVRI